MPVPTITARPEKTVNGVVSRWNAATLPLIYDITNTKWPTNSEDSTIAITSITDDNGSAKINRGSNDGEVVKEWILIDGTTNYDGPQQITAVDGDNLTIDAPFVDNDTGTTLIYFQNYTTLIRVFAGLAPNHDHAALKPITLIGTIEQRPDTDNITLADVREYVKNKLNTIYDESLASWPNDINAFTDFYISFAERYDLVTAGVVGDFTSDFTLDLENGNVIFLKAVHSAQQFGYPFGGNMGEYVVNNSFYADLAKWMTFFERNKIIDYNNFNISIIIDTEDTYGIFPLLEIQEFDSNDNLILLTEQFIVDNFYGVYRLPIDLVFNTDTAYVNIQLMIGGIESSELHRIDIDVECFDFIDAITTLSADATSKSDIDLSWINTSEDFAINIKRSLTSGGPYDIIGQVEAGSTTFTDTGLTESTAYFYVVNYAGQITDSNEANGFTFYEFGKAIIPDGIDDFGAIASLNGESFTVPFTYYNWIKIDENPIPAGEIKAFLSSPLAGNPDLILFHLFGGAASTRWTMQLNSPASVNAVGGAGGPGFDNTDVSQGDKLLLVFSVTSTEYTGYIYKVGVGLLVSLTDTITAANLPSGWGSSRAFTDRLLANRYLQQKIAEEAMIINEAFTLQQVTDLFNNGGGNDVVNLITTGSLFFQYKFDDDATDETGNHDMTLNNWTPAGGDYEDY